MMLSDTIRYCWVSPHALPYSTEMMLSAHATRADTLVRLQHGEVDDDRHPGDEDASEAGIKEP